MAYNALDRITQNTDPLGQSTNYAYDGNGNLISVVDPNGGKTQFSFDARNRRTVRTDALNQAESVTYDNMDNVLTYTDRKGQQASYQNDALNRVSKATYADASTVTFTYDAGNRVSQIVDSVSGTITRSYDDFDRLMQELTPQGSVSYTYDALGRRATMTPGSQAQITYTYDNANRLTKIQQGSETVSIAYDAANRRTSLTLPNGVVTSYTYDAGNQVTGIIYQTAGGATLSSLAYIYDAAGRRSSQTGGFLPDMLATASATVGAFDLNNRQTQWNGMVLGYDKNGDASTNAAASQSYTFDARHRLVQIQNSGTGATLATFAYDPLGRRTSKTVGGNTTSFLYDGVDAVQETQSGTNYSILTGLGIDERYARSETSGRYYFLTDALGSTLGLSDSSGTVQQKYVYEPYGEMQSQGSSNNPYQYTGRENDGIGLYYYRARYYSPSLKRFISEDPLGLAAGVNGYGYVRGRPTTHIDPTGEIDWYSWEVAGKFGMLPVFTGLYLIVYETDKFGTACSCDDSVGPGVKSLVSVVGGGSSLGGGVAVAAEAGGSAAAIGGLGIASAAVGGWEIGRGFNLAWGYFSDCKSTFGTWIYDVTHDESDLLGPRKK